MISNPAPETGLVVASHGHHVLVESAEGKRLICTSRGKKNQAVVGDHVRWLPSGEGGTIESVNPRRNLLYRQDQIRSKHFASNLDQVLILLAAEPEFSDKQLTRALIAAEAAHIQPLIGLNKGDLKNPFKLAWERLAPYRQMGYEVLPLAIAPKTDTLNFILESLWNKLEGKITLVLGPSGVGKSTLINKLVPGAQVLTREISHALNSGRHTTTNTLLYWVDADHRTALIDSPGFQEFGLHHIDVLQLPALMPDIQAHTGQCRFYNCTHLHEPGCGVHQAVLDAKISERRYRLYSELFSELSEAARY